MNVEIKVMTDVTDELVEAFQRLIPQLSRSAPPLDAEALRTLVTWQGIRLLVAHLDGQMVGTLTLVVFPIPTGLRAWIEDVVVDEAVRGKHVGAALTREAIRIAQAEGARTVDLTSRPSREAANRMYQRLDFKLRDSNVYRFAE
ncbi:GNAT family N-acetyltransferase [Streptomyces sp. NPDC058405]|uniref:GNAT family N-acetyltransferase n=1 Tax=unclassified Streptomyces TaxID=2593676 RepID=UPI0036681A04